MQHWLPYDEDRLLRLLRVDRETLWRHLRDDRRTIAQLAAGRGWPDPERLAATLVAQPRGRVPLDELRSRARRTLPRGTSHSTSCSTLCTRMRSPTTRDGRSACTAPTSSSGCAGSNRAAPGRADERPLARTRGAKRAAGAARARRGGRARRRAARDRPACSSRDSSGNCRAGCRSRTTTARRARTARQAQRAPGTPRGPRPRSARTAPRRRRGVRAEAAARLAARRDQRRVVDGRGGRRGGQPRASGARGPAVFGLQPRPLRRRAPRRLRDLGRQPQLRQALWRHLDRPGRPGGRSSATGWQRTRGHRPDRLRTRDLR